MKYAYYPGCSLEYSGVAYDQSVRKVAEVLHIELVEVDDWNCCGATEYFTRECLAAHSLIARNLALVPQELNQVTAPCAACHLNLKKVDHLMVEFPKLAANVNAALAAGDLHYEPGRLTVRHFLEVVAHDVGEEMIRSKVVRPLKDLRIAAYYGCQVVRPYEGFDNSEYPMKLDRVLAWLGAEVVDYPVKAHCCGGHMSQISEPEAFELIRRLLNSADEYEADVIACMCPMCQLNLDVYQKRVNNHFDTEFRTPILFFTQLMGLAFGLEPDDLGIGKEIVSAEPVLSAKLAPETAEVSHG